jgi:membrane protein DedA with SNARE-associated domain/rhodanese-related sulfurtransferase
MTHEIIQLITQYGLILVFINVLLEQAGVPIPAVPTLVVAGALAAGGKLSLTEVMLIALSACLISDVAWYWAGKHFGAGVMRTLCRISLSPDSCVKQSELRFQRWRGQILLIAKFVPGLSMIAPPLVGAMRLRLRAFLFLDTVGSLLWIGVIVGLGYVFAAQIDRILTVLASAGTIAVEFLATLLVIYVLGKWWQRHRLLASLRMASITSQELRQMIDEGKTPLVVDVRSQAARLIDARIIPGALLAGIEGIDLMVRDIPADHEIIMYCSCPNEVSAAKAAKILMQHGYRRVRPLLGGLDGWADAGYPIDEVPLADNPLGEETVVVVHTLP